MQFGQCLHLYYLAHPSHWLHSCTNIVNAHPLYVCSSTNALYSPRIIYNLVIICVIQILKCI